MIQGRKVLSVLFLLLIVACNSATHPLLATQVPASVQTPLATVTPIATATATAIATPTPTNTPIQAPTDTPLPKATATTDPLSATIQAMMGPLGAMMNISQYLHPVGTPLQSWHDVPVMPQATAGQEFSVQVYSYMAAATLAEAQKYYAGKTAALGMTNPMNSGSTGAGGQGVHSFTYFSSDLSIVLTSSDNDTGHVTVVISRVP
jgi:hypothetical protein